MGTLGPVVILAMDLNTNSTARKLPRSLQDQVLALEEERTATQAWTTGETLTVPPQRN